MKVKDCRILHPPPYRGVKRTLYRLQGKNCSCILTNDGTEDGMFHYSDDSCMSMWLLYLYAEQLCNDGRPLAAYVHDLHSAYEQLKLTSLAQSEHVPFCSVPHFRQVYRAWAIRMNRAFLFKCPECQNAPEVLIGDATSESIQARHYCGQPITDFDSDGPAEARPHPRADRCLFNSAADRKPLQDFAAYARGDGKTAFGHSGVTQAHSFVFEEHHPSLQHLLEAASKQDMASMVTDVGSMYEDSSSPDRKVLAKMLRSMASDSPVASYLPREIAALVGALLANPGDRFPSELNAHSVPTVIGILCCFRQDA